MISLSLFSIEKKKGVSFSKLFVEACNGFNEIKKIKLARVGKWNSVG